MSKDGIFKAEIVYIRDSDEGQGGTRTALEDRTGDEEEQDEPYKIKCSYKALAAIPTNTLLLEQQAIDERVENEQKAPDGEADTHTEMCSPAQLRQESEELYAAIDKVLENPMQMRRSRSMPVSLVKCVNPETAKPVSLLKSAGRETKYAAFNIQPAAPMDKHLTKPGVIRPVNVIPKVPEEDEKEEFHLNPFKQYLQEISKDKQTELINRQRTFEEATATVGSATPEPGQDDTPTKGGGSATPLLIITEGEEDHAHQKKGEPSDCSPAPLGDLWKTRGVRETHM